MILFVMLEICWCYQLHLYVPSLWMHSHIFVCACKTCIMKVVVYLVVAIPSLIFAHPSVTLFWRSIVCYFWIYHIFIVNCHCYLELIYVEKNVLKQVAGLDSSVQFQVCFLFWFFKFIFCYNMMFLCLLLSLFLWTCWTMVTISSTRILLVTLTAGL